MYEALQTMIVPALAGAIVWIVLYIWQHTPWLKGLTPDTANLTKLATAIAAAAVGAIITVQTLYGSDWSLWWPVFCTMLTSSQAVQALVKGLTPDKT